MGTGDKASAPAVRQANALAKSAQQMELNEKRLVFLAMSRIRWDDEDFLTCDLPVGEIQDWFGGNPYQEVKRTADNLLKRVVHIKGDQGYYRKFQWTTLSEYIPASQHPDGVSVIRLRFNSELRSYLLMLSKRYNAIPLEPLLMLPSFNAQRLYEVLWHDSHAGKKPFLTYDIAELKTFLGLRDPAGKWEKYDQWRDFRKLLLRLQKAIEPIGPLRVTRFTGLKQNSRSYNQIRFEIALETADALPTLPTAPLGGGEGESVDELTPEWLTLAAELREAGYNQDPVAAIKLYGFEVVARTLKLARRAERDAATTRNPIRNLGGLIARMLQRGVGRQAWEQKVQTLSHQDVLVQVKTLQDAYSLALGNAAQALWDSFDEATQVEVLEVMQASLNATQRAVLERSAPDNPAFRSIRNSYLFETYPDEYPEELSDMRAFIVANGLLIEYDDEERQRILTALDDT